MQPITEFSFFVVEREKPIKCHDRSLIVLQNIFAIAITVLLIFQF